MYGTPLTPLTLSPPSSDEIKYQKERGGLGDVLNYNVRWFLFWLKVGGRYVWMWHRGRLQWCERDDVGWVPLAFAECTEFRMGDHVWHGPFDHPKEDVQATLTCQPCTDKHNALCREQEEKQ